LSVLADKALLTSQFPRILSILIGYWRSLAGQFLSVAQKTSATLKDQTDYSIYCLPLSEKIQHHHRSAG
jgi:hypothetical protein